MTGLSRKKRNHSRPLAVLAVLSFLLLFVAVAHTGDNTSALIQQQWFLLPVAHSFVTPTPCPVASLLRRRQGRSSWQWKSIRGGGGGGGGSATTSSETKTTTTTSTAATNDNKSSTAETEQQGQGGTTAVTTTSLSSSSAKPSATTQNPLVQYNASAIDAGSMTIPALYDILQSSDQGLDQAQAESRLAFYGPNALASTPRKSLWALVLEQFQDRLVQILLIVAVVSAIFSFVEVSQSVGHHQSSDQALWKSFVEPGVILAILVINAFIGVVQSQSAADSLAALQDMQSASAVVVRNGTPVTLPSREVVPGDVVQVRVGDKIPADARVVSLQTSTLFVDEGSLTGESVTVSKLPGLEGQTAQPNQPIQDQKGMLYAGTVVTSGTGWAIVTQTGMATQFGRIQQGVTTAAAEATKTPLAIKLDEFGDTLTIIIGVICFAVWVVSIPKMNDPSFATVWEGAIYYAKVAVALGVAAIPEGLPAVITLCLSLGTRRMAERNVLVRKLPSVETLGSVSVICSDKTGTLTQNEMTAVSLVVCEHDGTGKETLGEHAIEGISYSPFGKIEGIPSDTEVHEHPLGAIAEVAAVSALCNDANIVGNDNVDGTKKDAKAFERMGEPTEAALCVLAEKLGGMSHYLEGDKTVDNRGLHLDVPPSILANANVASWRDLHPRIATLEFSRDRKSMSVLCSFPHGDYPATVQDVHAGVPRRKAGNRLLVKGAPNLLLERCTNVKFRDGTVSKMTGALRRSIEEKISEMAARPLRCLALAVKENTQLEDTIREFAPKEDRDVASHPLLADPNNFKAIESDLTLVGIVGIKDPARPEVADSINECTRAGIRVMMITGDAKDTAVAIARDVNIFPKDSDKPIKAFQGREFFQKPEKEQLEILKEDNIVFCRAEPADKQKLVKMLQSLGEIPAMTGDGVNDAPALQQAAIGVAMGITGTEVSKEAADMVLADDNFATIVSAVEEGRRIYANMQAFICFLISCNIGEICAIFFATLLGFPEPLTAMHLLWVNLVTDGPPATALGFNPPAPDLMEQPPRPSDEPIMTRWLLTRYCLTGLYVGLATIGVFAQHYQGLGVSLAELASWSQCGQFWKPADGTLSCTDLFQGEGRMLPQTLSLTTLVCMEMLKALSAVSVDSSLLRVGPQSNPWLLLGVSVPFLLHLFVLYSAKLGLPALGESFGMVPLSTDDWVTVLCWAAPILLVDEILKAVGRYINSEERKARREAKRSSSTA